MKEEKPDWEEEQPDWQAWASKRDGRAWADWSDDESSHQPSGHGKANDGKRWPDESWHGERWQGPWKKTCGSQKEKARREKLEQNGLGSKDDPAVRLAAIGEGRLCRMREREATFQKKMMDELGAVRAETAQAMQMVQWQNWPLHQQSLMQPQWGQQVWEQQGWVPAPWPQPKEGHFLCHFLNDATCLNHMALSFHVVVSLFRSAASAPRRGQQ